MIERLGNIGSRRRDNVARIIAVSIAAMVMAFLFLSQFLGFDFDLYLYYDYVHARQHQQQPRSLKLEESRDLNLGEYKDPKSIDSREELEKRISQLSTEVNEFEHNLVQCENFSKNEWLRVERDTQDVTIQGFWNNSDCFHDFSKSVTFFHAGKAGGGTAERELELSRIGILNSHPYPRSTHIEQLHRGPLTTLILNVRDPVDRYVSAFRWGLQMLCGKYRKHDKRCKSHLAYVKEETEEWKLMTTKYKSDPNVLAEALCEESPMYQEAAEDYKKMQFMGHKRPLTNWIDFLINPPAREDSFTENGIQNLIALPMEKQVVNGTSFFNQHIKQLSLHLLQLRYDPETAREILLQRPADTDLTAKARQVHSTGTSKSSALSPLGECCMARKLQGDYQLIQTMLGYDSGNKDSLIVEPLSYAHPAVLRACSWGSEEQQELCRWDLRFMLLRRARYLDRSLGTCSNAVAGIAST